MGGNQLTFFSHIKVPLSLAVPLSLSKINKNISFGDDFLKIHTKTHYNQTVERERILKEAKEDTQNIQGILNKIKTQFFSINQGGQEAVG